MVRKSNPSFDPLDLEILERAFDGAWAAFKENRLVSNAEFEGLLYRELTQIAAFNGANDVQAIRDIILSAALARLWRDPGSDLG
jgi:hypothetical protein